MPERESRQPKFSEAEMEEKHEEALEKGRKVNETPEEYKEYIKKPYDLEEKFGPLLLKSESRKSVDPKREAGKEIIEIKKWHGWIHHLPLENLPGVLKYGIINPILLEEINQHRHLKDYYQYAPKIDGLGGEIYSYRYQQPIVFVCKLGYDPESKKTFNITNLKEEGFRQHYGHLPVAVMCDLSRYDCILTKRDPDYEENYLGQALKGKPFLYYSPKYNDNATGEEWVFGGVPAEALIGVVIKESPKNQDMIEQVKQEVLKAPYPIPIYLENGELIWPEIEKDEKRSADDDGGGG